MFENIIVPLIVTIVLFIGYLFVRAYKPTWVGIHPVSANVIRYNQDRATEEAFVAAPPPPTKMNTPPSPMPSPATVVKQDPIEEERVISPGGPSTPNAAAPLDTPAYMSPEVKPIDPYEDSNMEASIQDSMRHPELSFGPGVDNTGMNQLATSGVADARAMANESKFSPDFAQNGGSFMGSVVANDLTHDDSYAMA